MLSATFNLYYSTSLINHLLYCICCIPAVWILHNSTWCLRGAWIRCCFATQGFYKSSSPITNNQYGLVAILLLHTALYEYSCIWFRTEYSMLGCSVSTEPLTVQRRYFKTFKDPRNRLPEINFASLCSLAGRYDNSIPTRFLAPIDCSKIPELFLSRETTSTFFKFSLFINFIVSVGCPAVSYNRLIIPTSIF